MASPLSLYVKIQYPRSVGVLSEEQLDIFLQSIQKSQVLYQYACTLSALTVPDNETIPINTPSVYCKTAPSQVTTKSDDLIPLILVELLFVMAVSPSEADLITNTIDGLIRQQLVPEKSNVSIKILVSSLSGKPSQKGSFGSDLLPLPYYQLHGTSTAPQVNYPVILMAFLCLGILLLNFALHFHFE